MKKIILIFLVCISSVVAKAQTIHWLTFIDTEDPQVGELDKTGRSVLYGRFVNVVNAALRDKGYKSNIRDIYDSALTPEKCKAEVENLACDENDIIVFYYIGHGTHAQAENNPYPQMLLGCDFSEEHKFIPLKWVHDELKTKGARLTLSIGMCCNVIQTASAKRTPTFSVNYGNVELTNTERNSIQKMFLGYTGDFILSSASVGQSSVGGSTPLGDMDLFTAVLVTIFGDMAYEGNLEWNSLFTEVKGIVNSVTGGNQTPFWNNNLVASAMPQKRPVSPGEQKRVVSTPNTQNNNPGISTTKTSVNINDMASMCNYLSSHFDCMVDNSNSRGVRKNEVQIIKQLFSDDAIVKIIPQDVDSPVVDKEAISVFLTRISTNEGSLLKVVPVSYKHSGLTITELTVRECYNK